MRPESVAIVDQSGLRQKLQTVTGVRVLMVTLLLLSAVVVNLDQLESFREPGYLAMVGLVVLTYLASAAYSLAHRYAGELTGVAYAHLVGDGVLVGGLVLVTGGSESVFLFLFFLSIITASFLLGRAGALFAASVASVAYAAIALAQGGHLGLLMPLGAFFGATTESAPYAAAVHVGSFYAVALLAGNLAERLGQVGTELERRRIDVRKLRALNENIVNSVAGGLCTLDLADRVIGFNRAAATITGLDEDQILGRWCREVLPDLANHLDAHRSHAEPPDRHDPIVRFERGDRQRRFLDVSIAPLHDAGGNKDGYILSFTDVTEVRRLQEVLQRQKRLAAVGQLSASIAHEIRNPLAGISGAVQVLAEGAQLSEQHQQLMAIALREIDRLNNLVGDFLGYARPKELNPERVDIDRLLEECALLARQDQRLGDGIKIEVRPSDQAPLTVRADADALREVLWNLTRNAAESIDGAGTITLEAKRAGSGPSAGVAVSVTDTGSGLPPEAKRRLFEPFFTTKATGTGLGLATAHRAVEAHGGLIWSEDGEGGRGTRFWVVIPNQQAGKHVSHAQATAVSLSASMDDLLAASLDDLLVASED